MNQANVFRLVASAPMSDRWATTMFFSWKRDNLASTALLTAVLVAVPSVTISSQEALAGTQKSAPQKLEFEVASVRQNKTDEAPTLNIDPTLQNGPVPEGGLYVGKNVKLIEYIMFAYKLTQDQLRSVVSQVPWTDEDRFDIEARANGNPTKEQYRLMMQSLLVERFKLTLTYETRIVPRYALVLAKPPELGPHLRLHRADDPFCVQSPSVSAAPNYGVDAEGYPEACGGPQGMKPSGPGRMKSGGRDVSLSRFAAIITGVGAVDRPMVDETGIKDNVDYVFEWAKVAANVGPGVSFEPDESAPTFEQALRQQLGLKMVSGKGPITVVHIDRIEHPTAN